MTCPIPGHKDCPGYHPMVQEHEDWTWIENLPSQKGLILRGKYLFFSTDRKLLVEIAKAEIGLHGFHYAKVSNNPWGEDVLCLYSEDDSRKTELADRYADKPNLRYRYWKSNADTEAGKYSEEFLKKEREFS